MLSIGVIGTGYVGLVHAVVMAEFENSVIAMDINKEKIERLNEGIIPIYEPGLEELLKKNMQLERIRFTSDIKDVVQNSDIIFIAVGTPPKEDGSADLHYVMDVAEQISEYINKDLIVVNKSTVPIGTGKMIEKWIKEQMRKRKIDYQIEVVSNPEFLREGKAIRDTLCPDRIVVGVSSTHAAELMKEVYKNQLQEEIPFVVTSIETAEMIKYAANAFLAVKISFINEIAGLAEKVGADTNKIAYAMGLDKRISPEFLKAGAGYGGSCFPKDTRAISQIAKDYDETMLVIDAAIEANRKQQAKMVEKIVSPFKRELVDEQKEPITIGIWGLSFKPDTDDMREAPAIYIINQLVDMRIEIKTYCPGAMEEAKWRLSDKQDHIKYCLNAYEAADNVDALVIITEWKEFENVDMKIVKKIMRGDYLFDLRNIFYCDKEVMTLFKYNGVGFKYEEY